MKAMVEVLNDALSNLEHDNYERSHKGYENRQADVALIRAALASAPVAGEAFQDECAATGQSCSYGPHGPKGERQCKYCGAAPQASPAADGRDAKDAVVASIQAAIDGMKFDNFNATPRQMEFIKAGARRVINEVNAAIAAQKGKENYNG